ncbi:MAG: hypothetical protein FJ290_19960 [Planctomycetes bacterium]|nr:hypothetical protein [Planctomycetota bacterium]
MGRILVWAMTVWAWAGPMASPVRGGATTRTVAAGETLSLDGDLVLLGNDVLEINGTAGEPCTLVGNGHQAKTKGNWTGHVKATHCTFRQLGKTLRKDAGFALNDIPRGGEADQQVDPQFAGPLPTAFPFRDEDIKAGKLTVSQMLTLFRKAYAPAEGSPLIDAGDPADGEGADIGAVGAGKPHKDDCFGRFPAAAP